METTASSEKKRSRSQEEEDIDDNDRDDDESAADGMQDNRERPTKQNLMYLPALLTKKLALSMAYVNRDIEQTLLQLLTAEVEGKCIPEGYVRPKSVKIDSYSSGVTLDANVIFDVVYRAEVCYPLEGKIVPCVIQSISRAGIQAHVHDDYDPSSPARPITVFIARDYTLETERLARMQRGDKIYARIEGVRFEIGDTCIYTIATLVDDE